MSAPSRPVQMSLSGMEGGQAGGGISPAKALSDAFSDTIQILLNPFEVGRWLKLSLICLFLGGGTSSAAFHWVLTTLPGEVGFQGALAQLKTYLAGLPGFLYISFGAAGCLGVAIIYARATCRFALVESILKGEPRFWRGGQDRRWLVRSYFLWLLGILAAMGAMLGASVLFALPRLRGEAGPGEHSLLGSVILAGFLLGEVSIGLLAGILVTVTDDFAVPIMFAENLSLVIAWKRLATILRAEPLAFSLYFLVRLVASVALGVVALFLLFPVLVALFSGTIVVGVSVLLILQLVGLVWVWTPVTVLGATLALSVLLGILLVLLGVAGMPGQVLLQTFGMRFLSPRLPSLDALWQVPSSSEEHD